MLNINYAKIVKGNYLIILLDLKINWIFLKNKLIKYVWIKYYGKMDKCISMMLKIHSLVLVVKILINGHPRKLCYKRI
jgi:hypothetical protein